MIDNFGYAAGPSGEGDHFKSHGFERGQSEGLKFARHQHDVGDADFVLDFILLAEEKHVVVNTFLYREPFGNRAVRAVADKEKAGRDLLVNAVEDFDDVSEALDRTKIR